jgi:hypothetical protein
MCKSGGLNWEWSEYIQYRCKDYALYLYPVLSALLLYKSWWTLKKPWKIQSHKILCVLIEFLWKAVWGCDDEQLIEKINNDWLLEKWWW